MAEFSERGGPFFHGGVPGLEVGDELLPPRITRNGEPRAWDRDSIHVTRKFFIAEMHAARWPYGDVYRVAVEHVEHLEVVPWAPHSGMRRPAKPDALLVPWPSIRVAAAVVVGIVHRKWRETSYFFASEIAMGVGRGEGSKDEVRTLEPMPPRTDVRERKAIKRRRSDAQ